jgi:hypothetical protein
MNAFRCSAASRELAEPREGTASTVRAFLLVEHAGPWGVEALRDARLDGEVKVRLRRLEASTGVRPLLIRRSGRARSSKTRLFGAWARGRTPWVETTALGDVRELLDLDLEPLTHGRSLGLTPHADPVLLVCTHGRHDACCAERGRPLYAALRGAARELTWEVSHIGGDRFAPNVLVLPHGLYYGGLDPEDVDPFLEAQLAGRLDLEHLRGRTAYPFAMQVAEFALRRRLGLLDVSPLPVTAHERAGAKTRVVFEAAGEPWEVRVRTTPGPPRRLTCSAVRDTAPPVHEVIELRRLDASPRPT